MSSCGPRGLAKLGLPTPGRAYVLNDGGEVDLDLGAYEWSLNVMLSRDNNIAAEKYTKRSSKKRRVIFKRGRNIGINWGYSRAKRSTCHWRHTGLNRARRQDPGGQDGRGAGRVYR